MSASLIAVTGGTGFIGAAVCKTLYRAGHSVRVLARTGDGDRVIGVGDIGSDTDWSRALDDVQCVIHTAGRAHIPNYRHEIDLDSFREVNVEGTRRLAEQAASVGVKRLVFISSIKVNGEQTNPGEAFNATDTVAPSDAYGLLKLEAELVLKAVSRETALEIVIVRPPLVYGPGVRANFLRLMRIVERGWLLPFGAVNNRRSLVALDNLADLLVCCAKHPAASGETFLVSDGRDISTPELIRMLADLMGRTSRLVPVPVALLRLAGKLSGHRAEMERLVGSLQVNIKPTRDTLDWSPRILIEEALAGTVAEYKSTRR